MAAACTNSNSDAVDDAFAELDEAAGNTVDNVDIGWDNNNPTSTIDIAGVELTLPELDGYRFGVSGETVMPPTWPTLDRREGYHIEQVGALPRYGFAVFKQTTLVTDDTKRQNLIDQLFSYQRMADDEVLANTTTTGPNGRTCWVETRLDPDVFDDFRLTYNTIMVAGPDIASIAIATRISNPDIDETVIIGDIVEQICGQRPAPV